MVRNANNFIDWVGEISSNLDWRRNLLYNNLLFSFMLATIPYIVVCVYSTILLTQNIIYGSLIVLGPSFLK